MMKIADFVEKYLHKGTKIAIEGRLQSGSYEKDGQKHYTTDIVVNKHEFCESKKPGGNDSTDGIPEGFQALDDDDIPF